MRIRVCAIAATIIICSSHSYALAAPQGTNADTTTTSSGITSKRATSQPGWLLYQHNSLLGSFFVFITKNSIKIDGTKPAWSIIAKAPKWNAVFYSRGDKTICEVPYSVWSKRGFAFGEPAPSGPPKSVKPLSTNYKDTSAKKLQWIGQPSSNLGLRSDADRMPKTCTFTLTIADEIDVAPQAILLINQVHATPAATGVPLQLSSTAELRPLLTTQSIEPRPITDTTFDAPKGLRAVASDSDVLYNDTDKRNINNIGEMFGIEQKEEPKTKKTK